MTPQFLKKRYYLLLLIVLGTSSLIAQDSIFDLFPADSIIKVEIKTNLKKLVKEKSNPVYQDAVFTIVSGAHTGKTYNIKVKPRGNARRKICQYPPIKFKFPKSDFTFNKVKWVGVCRDNKQMKEILLKEYLAYKLYNVLTDYSYKVRLLQVDFKAPEAVNASLSAYGFFVEPTQELAQRTETKHYEPRTVKTQLLDRYHYPLLSVFEYLIGNTDWHMDSKHNVKFLRSSKLQTIIPVPYDFDYSGIVDAPYSVPHETIPIKNVKERYNKSHCLTDEECKEVCKLICSQKENLYACIVNFDLLSERVRKIMYGYLDSGIEILEHKKWSSRVFVKQCEECPK